MAKGFPDFFGVSTFPHYGGAQEDEGSVLVTINDTTDLTTIVGKGHIYHIEMSATVFSSAADDNWIITIDGVEYYTARPSTLLRQGYINPILGAVCLTNYTLDTPEFTMWLIGIITFSDSVLLQYEERSGNICRASHRIRYTRIV